MYVSVGNNFGQTPEFLDMGLCHEWPEPRWLLVGWLAGHGFRGMMSRVPGELNLHHQDLSHACGALKKATRIRREWLGHKGKRVMMTITSTDKLPPSWFDALPASEFQKFTIPGILSAKAIFSVVTVPQSISIPWHRHPKHFNKDAPWCPTTFANRFCSFPPQHSCPRKVSKHTWPKSHQGIDWGTKDESGTLKQWQVGYFLTVDWHRHGCLPGTSNASKNDAA